MQPVQLTDDSARITFKLTESDSVVASTLVVPDSVPLVIQGVIQEYTNLFQDPDGLPPSRPFDHQIPLIPRTQPVNVRPYRYGPHQKTEIEKQVTKMLQKGIIQRSMSSFASLVLLVKKKDDTWRFCVDYRQLNNVTVQDKHPLPVVDELLEELHGAKVFTKLDCRSGYHQIRLAVGDEMKTTFKTHHGLYEFKVMPTMNTIFAPLLRKGVLVFMDDILVYSTTLEEHAELLKQVFDILQKNEFYLKWSKCAFAQSQLEYLGAYHFI